MKLFNFHKNPLKIKKHSFYSMQISDLKHAEFKVKSIIKKTSPILQFHLSDYIQHLPTKIP